MITSRSFPALFLACISFAFVYPIQAGNEKILFEYGRFKFKGNGEDATQISIEGIEDSDMANGIERLYLDAKYPLRFRPEGSGMIDATDQAEYSVYYKILPENKTLTFTYQLPRVSDRIRYERGNGTSTKEAIMVKGVQNSFDQYDATINYLKNQFPESDDYQEEHILIPRAYEKISFKDKEGNERIVYFDLNDPDIKPPYAKYAKDLKDLIPSPDRATWKKTIVADTVECSLPDFLFSVNEIKSERLTAKQLMDQGLPPITDEQLHKIRSIPEEKSMFADQIKLTYDLFSNEEYPAFSITVIHAPKLFQSANIATIENMADILNDTSHFTARNAVAEPDTMIQQGLRSAVKILIVNNQKLLNQISISSNEGHYIITDNYYYFNQGSCFAWIAFTYQSNTGVPWQQYVDRIVESFDFAPYDQSEWGKPRKDD